MELQPRVKEPAIGKRELEPWRTQWAAQPCPWLKCGSSQKARDGRQLVLLKGKRSEARVLQSATRKIPQGRLNGKETLRARWKISLEGVAESTRWRCRCIQQTQP